MKTGNPGAIIENSIRARLPENVFERAGKKETLVEAGCASRPYLNIFGKYFSKETGTDLPDSPFEEHKADIFCSATALGHACFAAKPHG
jgi:hypothetical protein